VPRIAPPPDGAASSEGLRFLRERLTFFLGFFVGGLWFLLCSAAGIVWLLVRPRNRQTLYVFGKVFCRGIVRLMGWDIRVEHGERLEACRPCVIVGNHQSFLDVITFGSIFPRRTVSAGKREIERIPVFGWFYRLSGNLIIDRANPRLARHSLAAAARVLRDERVSVWFMPEGHRNRGGELLPFKTGAFRLAIAAGVSILPIVAEPLSAIADTRRKLARSGTLRVRVLESIPTDGLSQRALPDLVGTVRARMQHALDGYRESERARA
jgi:1-acyl-sn-glycerol-3-phosphate acyltransferase